MLHKPQTENHTAASSNWNFTVERRRKRVWGTHIMAEVWAKLYSREYTMQACNFPTKDMLKGALLCLIRNGNTQKCLIIDTSFLSVNSVKVCTSKSRMKRDSIRSDHFQYSIWFFWSEHIASVVVDDCYDTAIDHAPWPLGTGQTLLGCTWFWNPGVSCPGPLCLATQVSELPEC